MIEKAKQQKISFLQQKFGVVPRGTIYLIIQ